MAVAGPVITGSSVMFTHTVDGVLYVLRGKESKYLTDDAHCTTLTDPTTGAIFTLDAFRDRQRFTAPAGQDLTQATLAAKHEYTIRANAIAIANGGFNIRYDTPVAQTAVSPFSFRVNFRYLAVDAKYGIVKGNREGMEDPKLTAKREFYEEVGTNYHENAFRTTRLALPLIVGVDGIINNGYKLFNSSTHILSPQLPLTPNIIHDQILVAIAGRTLRRYGEMYDLEFVPMAKIIVDYLDFNGRSKAAITSFREAFNIAGGYRRKHKHRHTHKHKRTSGKHKQRSSTLVRK